MKVGDPLDPETFIGPLAAERLRARIGAYIESGIAQGASLAIGGLGLPDGISKGAFVKPTVFADADNSCGSPSITVVVF
jgi:aldehyde dehydrogenase (NAD+)